jgi:LEA14-like dessication related protein
MNCSLSPGKIIAISCNQLFDAILVCWLAFLVAACAPTDPVQFKSIRNIALETDSLGSPILKGEALFFNPNHVRMKLKEVKIEVFVNGKKAADVDQKPNLVINGNSEFSAFVEARLNLKEIGLLDTVLSLFGGKKYGIEYIGYIRVRVHGITVKIPINFKDELKLKF